MGKKCELCIHNEQCKSDRACEYFDPIIDKDDDDGVDALIEEGRVDFRAEWFRYIEISAD